MLNFLVETKQEYTTQLINIMTPLIFEGLISIYSEVLSISIPENILKNFQCFLQRIPKWNNDLIKRETSRIMNSTKSFSWLEDLIKATLKANIVVLTYNPSFKNQIKVDPSLYQNIKIEDFVHKVYIECARELWNNPYLFYHLYQPIELKRNQRDTIILIKDCIKEAIRKLLPVKHILHIYLGEDIEPYEQNNNFDETISEAEKHNLSKMIKKDLYNDINYDTRNKLELKDNKLELKDNKLELKDNKLELKDNKLELKDNKLELKDNKLESKNNIISELNNKINDIEMYKNTKTSEVFIPNNTENIEKPKLTENNTVGSKILSIINHKNLNFSDDDTSSENLEDLNVNKIKNNNLESDIKKVLENDFEETETSINLPNKEEGFHEVFSNSIVEEDVKKPSNQFTNQNKLRFFHNYLTNLN